MAKVLNIKGSKEMSDKYVFLQLYLGFPDYGLQNVGYINFAMRKHHGKELLQGKE